MILRSKFPSDSLERKLQKFLVFPTDQYKRETGMAIPYIHSQSLKQEIRCSYPNYLPLLEYLLPRQFWGFLVFKATKASLKRNINIANLRAALNAVGKFNPKI